MKTLAQFIAMFAVLLFREEWLDLRKRLASAYRLHVENNSCRPTLLAQQLLISGEDHRFFSHGGIDFIAICRAIWRGIILRQPEGASTIEMQVVRVISGRFERTFKRKVREMALATLVTREIPKDVLPAVYLWIGYYGWRMNGFKAACHQLKLNTKSLTPMESARLVARLKYPQPHETRLERWIKINTRARHLLWLHMQHRCGNTYEGLVVEPQYAII
jgi:membrane carboxypeptidase/penicillin-binding protein PbpC